MSSPDLVIRGGRVMDPATQLNAVFDVAVTNGRIADMGLNLPEGKEEVDARNCFVCPGLVDIHAYVFQHATTMGVNPDQVCLANGVTTVIDAGSSGALTLEGLRKFIAEKSKTRVLAFLNIARQGLSGTPTMAEDSKTGGECDYLASLDKDLCANVAKKNDDLVVGITVRLSKTTTNNGRTEHEAFLRAFEAARLAHLPLMVQHSSSTIPFGSKHKDTHSISIPKKLSSGDIYTRLYGARTGTGTSILDCGGNIRDAFCDARERGVLFDVGHGSSSFDWQIAEAAASEHFWPSIISTGLNAECPESQVKNLPNVMSKFLQLGMPVPEIIKSVTLTPSKSIGRDNEIGSLQIGRHADIVMLKSHECRERSDDSARVTRTLLNKFAPVRVWKGGKACEVSG